MNNIFKKTHLIFKALKAEDELSLAHLYGQKLSDLEHLNNKRFRFSGIFFQVLIFFRFLLINLKLWRKPFSQADVLVFAGIDNQFNSLLTTVESLVPKTISMSIVLHRRAGEKYRARFDQVQLVEFGVSNLLITLALFFTRALPLYLKLRTQNRRVEIDQYFNVFCQSYTFLPYFFSVLTDVEPKLVVMSNDLNVENRCLRLAAEVMGIKTLYMQHASVSELFPPLEFDYALLDGEAAMKTYSSCFQLVQESDTRIKNNVANCTVILSGQKKPVAIPVSTEAQSELCVGIGVNGLDDFNCVRNTLDLVVENKVKCIVRTHPCQPQVFREQLHNYVAKYNEISWSDSRSNSLVDFFSEISCLIAGNTSLHLEAALAGLATFYWEMSNEVHLPDYFGYVKNGVSMRLPQQFNLDELNAGMGNAHTEQRKQSIKQYSETYQTPWQDKEGELAAVIIQRIIANHGFDGVMHQQNKPGIYKAIYRLNAINVSAM